MSRNLDERLRWNESEVTYLACFYAVRESESVRERCFTSRECRGGSSPVSERWNCRRLCERGDIAISQRRGGGFEWPRVPGEGVMITTIYEEEGT
ncbi:hypothetical protein Y032_0019g3816 [Ancylostoma ceylanicum]|uniref:Uncharacterized protein n=1 Tax=Ancylostoma ceylanicum TaxID=53326 RepID=A0A016V334_9BILA|nr:hypothetical protein Y032_0019g3816 [Ancylostoma ceylanicum]